MSNIHQMKRLRTATWSRARIMSCTLPQKNSTSSGKCNITIEEAEALNHAMVREFDGDPAATDLTRVLRLPGFANKKYEADFYVQAHTESTQTYHLREFKLQMDSPDAPWHQHEGVARKLLTQSNTLSQSEHDWAFAKRAFARGDEYAEVIRRIADYRGADKYDHESYARRTVTKAQAELTNEAWNPATYGVYKSPSADKEPDH